MIGSFPTHRPHQMPPEIGHIFHEPSEKYHLSPVSLPSIVLRSSCCPIEICRLQGMGQAIGLLSSSRRRSVGHVTDGVGQFGSSREAGAGALFDGVDELVGDLVLDDFHDVFPFV